MHASRSGRRMSRLRRSVRFAGGFVTVLIALAALTTGLARAGAAPSNPAAETVGPMVTTPWLDDADITPAIVNDGGEYYAIVSDGNYVWHRWAGTSIDAMSELGIADYSSVRQQQEGVNKDDREWLSDIWIDPSTGVWYGFVHVEYDYTSTTAGAQIGHTRRVVLARSTDQGATWQIVSDILTQGPLPSSAPAGAVEFGDGDQRLVVDSTNGYLYLFYTTGYYLPTQTWSSGNPVTWISVARCPMADIATPSCWVKWSGSFTPGTPGLGGADVPASTSPMRGGLTAASSIPMFTHDIASGEFVAIGNGAISKATDLGAENWTVPTAITGALSTDRCWYLWAFDPATGSRYAVGQAFRSYGAGAGCDSTARYQQINLGSGPAPETATSGSGLSSQDPWIYEYSAGHSSASAPVSFSPMTYVPARGWWQGSEEYCTVYSSDEQEPGTPGGCDAARTWRAPAAMTVTLGSSGPVTVRPCQASCGSGVELQIFRNGTQIWPAAGQPAVIVPNGGSYTFPDLTGISVNAGDDIEFLTSAVGADNYYDNTTWNQTVSEAGQSSDSYAPSPWRFQYTTNLSANPVEFSPMSYHALTTAWTAPSPYAWCWVFDSDLQSPGAPGSCADARTWRAPYSGTVTLGADGPISVAGGAANPQCGGNTAGVNLHIFHNGRQIWPPFASVNVPNGGYYNFPGLTGVSVSAGDDIEFVVTASGSVSYCDQTTWNPTVNGSTWRASDSFVQDKPFTYQYSTSDLADPAAITFRPMAYSASSTWWNGPAGYPYCDVYAADQQEPAIGCASARTWQAPYATTVTLPAATVSVAPCPAASSTYNPGTCSPGVDFEIFKTSASGQVQQIGSTVRVGHGNSATMPAASVAVNAGDDIEFVTAAVSNTATGAVNDNNWFDNATWDQVVTDPGPVSASYGQDPWTPEYSTDNGSTYTAMTSTGTNTWAAPGTYPYCTIYVNSSGINMQEPAIGCAASRTWRAPYATTVTLGSNGPVSVAPGCVGNTAGVGLRVFLNGSQIWPSSGSQNVPNGTSYTFPGLTTNVTAGDDLEFVTTANGSDNYCDNTTWDPTVTSLGHASRTTATEWYASATFNQPPGG